MRLTRQGVRDLGGNSRPRTRKCSHIWGGQVVVRWDTPYMGWQAEPVWGQQCVACGSVRK